MSAEDNIIPALLNFHMIIAPKNSNSRLNKIFDFFTTLGQMHYFGWQ